MEFKLAFVKDPVKETFIPYINVGCLLDVPTGAFVRGMKGEMILNGGEPPLMGIQGFGNTAKSTIAHFITMSALANSVYDNVVSTNECHDTENSLNGTRISTIANQIEMFKDVDLVQLGIYRIKQAKDYPGEIWFKELKEDLLTTKMKEGKGRLLTTPFLHEDEHGNISAVKMPHPCFSEVDALSTFKPSTLIKLEEDKDIDDPGRNMDNARAGLFRSRFLNEVSTLNPKTGHYMLVTAHLGKKTDFSGGGPMAPRPTKDMLYQKVDVKVKNAPEGFRFLPMVVFETHATLCIDKDRNMEYLPEPAAKHVNHGDLLKVGLTTIRNKNGASGITVELIVAQSEGVLPLTSQFNYLRTQEQEGITRSVSTYKLKLYPEKSFTKNEIRVIEREKGHYEFKRAMEITCDFFQMRMFMRNLTTYPNFDDFIEKIEKDYGWANLLHSRGHWTFDQYTHERPFLSTYDLLRMYHGEYVPYWWKTKKEEPKTKEAK